MFCSKCGALNNDFSEYCQSCGRKLQEKTKKQAIYESYKSTENSNCINQPMPSFKAKHSIILMICSLFCGSILGFSFALLSILEGYQIKKYAVKNDFENASICKRRANNWIKVTYIVLVVLVIFRILDFVFPMFKVFYSYA